MPETGLPARIKAVSLERGYALVEDGAGEPVVSAAAALAEPSLVVRLHDGRVSVRPEPPVD